MTTGGFATTGNFMMRQSPNTWTGEMPRNIYVVPYVLALIAVVVAVDVLFFRNQFWPRLLANIGIVLVFAAFGLRYLR